MRKRAVCARELVYVCVDKATNSSHPSTEYLLIQEHYHSCSSIYHSKRLRFTPRVLVIQKKNNQMPQIKSKQTQILTNFFCSIFLFCCYCCCFFGFFVSFSPSLPATLPQIIFVDLFNFGYFCFLFLGSILIHFYFCPCCHIYAYNFAAEIYLGNYINTK